VGKAGTTKMERVKDEGWSLFVVFSLLLFSAPFAVFLDSWDAHPRLCVLRGRKREGGREIAQRGENDA
jgi:hypothetical protein